MKEKVFLSGRITGDREYRAKFNRVADRLIEDGRIVLNPATLPMGLAYADYARICHAMIEACETVLLLPGWENSNGAKLERDYAKYIGKEIEAYDPQKTKPSCARLNWDEDDCNW